MVKTGAARVEAVIDGQTVMMNDGKIVRLLGIEYPFTAGQDVSEQMLAGKDQLGKWLRKGTDVTLWQSRNNKTGRINRMGQLLAHLETKKDNQWINGSLIGAGLVYVETDWNNPDLADQMYALESRAREKQSGVWKKDSAAGLLTPETAMEGNGAYRVVEGTVQRAASSKNNLYLNFGHDMKRDFTVQIAPSLRKELSRRGVDALALSGKKVRVRGWIRDWNGPFMELESVERLEILSTQPSTDLSPPPSTEISTPTR